MKVLLLTCMLGLWGSGAVGQPTTLLQQFLLDLTSKRLPTTTLEEKYFCPSLLQRQSIAGNKARTAADNYLLILQNQLNEQQVNITDVQFTPFDSLPAKEFELIGNTQQVYAAQYRGNILCYFLLKDDKIESFLLLNQGGRAYFVSFCE